MDLERVKARIRKLLDLAADDRGHDGEIAAAMGLAQQLLTAHQLSEADILAGGASGHDAKPAQPMGTVDAGLTGASYTTWETSLAWAIVKLVGTVGHYGGLKVERTEGLFKAPKAVAGYRFYGPEDDCEMAAALFEEWRHVIATMAAAKFGGVMRGKGAHYAYGFATALRDKVRTVEAERKAITTASTTALVRIGADRSLAALNAQTLGDAKTWLRDVQGVRLGSSRRAGYSSLSADAYGAGRADGAKADFSAQRRGRLTYSG